MDFEIRVYGNGTLWAQTLIAAEGKDEFADALIAQCEDAKSGEDVWLDDIDNQG